ncbi:MULTISPECIES: hypothetical protein [Agrobacterium]|uniref:Tail assembly chaperone n=1 Tax=Agrobacterium tumefaciens TaxID=358 RepID=A0AAE6EES4_AGRTU|nr:MULTISPECIES: hypothetical protein [Agrobacterium]QCL73405.1 hypothetical protein CFBP5499_08235 [Agrobacterium tumefaciens]QCL78977.1 hypothetical protein CFBP5877_07765 [Agrobacterium tumefaciens]CUX42359.1 conserved hypothetical protein [Agrobacterium sp. NCPPB 925]
MRQQRASFEQVEISHGGNALTLRPSLRAATILEERFGFPALHAALEDLNFTIISEIILVSESGGNQSAAAFLTAVQRRPLFPFFLAVRAPLFELVSMLTPAPEKRAQPLHATTKQVTWAEVFAALYDRATGWLGWTPEQAWNATPTEIDRAYRAHLEKLKAIHGGGSDDEKEPDPEQAERNVAAGLDPEFDRAGLQALKSSGRRK